MLEEREGAMLCEDIPASHACTTCTKPIPATVKAPLAPGYVLSRCSIHRWRHIPLRSAIPSPNTPSDGVVPIEFLISSSGREEPVTVPLVERSVKQDYPAPASTDVSISMLRKLGGGKPRTRVFADASSARLA